MLFKRKLEQHKNFNSQVVLWQYRSVCPQRKRILFTERVTRLAFIPLWRLTGLPSLFSKKQSWIRSGDPAYIQSYLVKRSR